MTAALAGVGALLAFLFHLGVAGGIPLVIGLPALWVAYLAVPATARRPTSGRRVREWDPVELGVHQVVGGGPMPAYVRRPHDKLLLAVLDPAVAVSRLVVLRGGSSTGKTRAAYEAVMDRLSDWQLDYPLDPGALAERLEAGIPARTVLWLGELRQYADADGGPAVLARLADLLEGKRHLVITTVWPEQWNTYIAAARAGPGAANPAGTAGRLLAPLPELVGSAAPIDPARGGVIDVPNQFTRTDLEAAARTDDWLLAAATKAAAAAGQDGQVTQYLAGVPDLLNRYAGPGGDPYGQAIITAAMDGTRLGHASPLPAALVQDAAVGYLTGPQRTAGIESWRDTGLAWATAELNGTVRALEPIPPPAGTGLVGYRIADYLDQHGRLTRQDQFGPASLWDALAAHTTSASDLARLGQAAQDRGLYRHATGLLTTAATLGNPGAAARLIELLHQVTPSDTTRAARWIADRVSLDDLLAIAELLKALCAAEADDAARTLATRAASQASLGNDIEVAQLLGALREAGADDAVDTLLARDPASQVSLDRPPLGVPALLGALRAAGADDAVDALAARVADQVSLDPPLGVAELLGALRAAGADDAARTLATRAASQASLEHPLIIAGLLRALSEAGAGDAVDALAARVADQVSLDDLLAARRLLMVLGEARADDAVDALAARVADQVSLDDPSAVAQLLEALRAVGADDAVDTLLARDPASQVSLDNPLAVALLLVMLRAAGAGDMTDTLLARDPANQASLDDLQGVTCLVEELSLAGAGTAAYVLAARAVSQASFDNPLGLVGLLRLLRAAGVDDLVDTLLARDPASQVSLDNLLFVAPLLRFLREAGADDAAHTLATRAASQASLDPPWGVAELLGALREAGADDAARTLATRAASEGRLDIPAENVAELLAALREAGADDAAYTLATRAANVDMFSVFLETYPHQAPRYAFGREPDGTPSQSWRWQEPGQPGASSADKTAG